MTRDARISDAILALATMRGASRTICPSEVARHVGGQDETVWRPLMEPVRAQAVKLAKRGAVVIRQTGKVMDPDSFSGVYRIGIPDG
jgi:hypothetical protein